jgi:hypothetical protein
VGVGPPQDTRSTEVSAFLEYRSTGNRWARRELNPHVLTDTRT